MENSHNASQDKTSTFKNLISQLFQKNGSLRDELVDFFDEQDTPINNEQLQMILNVVHLIRYDADKIKIPVTKMVTLPVDASLKKTIAVLKKSGHSRIPVYKNEDRHKNFIGLLYAKSLFSELAQKKGTRFKLVNYIRNLQFVPETQKLLSLLRDMRIKQNHLVMTVNEYGETTGLITLEDILEEIVGDIRDEFDSNKKTIQEIAHRQYRVDASVPLNHLNKELAVNFPEERFNTLAGYMLHQLKGNLRKGSEIQYGSVKLTLEKFSGQQIEQVLLDFLPRKSI